jgi:hypothetical protein
MLAADASVLSDQVTGFIRSVDSSPIRQRAREDRRDA